MGKHKTELLVESKLRTLKPGRHRDGNGLYLEVEESGGRHWIIRTMVQKKRRDIGLGGLSLVSLAQARDMARDIRKAAREGRDPIAERRKNQDVPTFREVATSVHRAHKDTWSNGKHADQWINTLQTYAFPVMGDMRVDAITQREALKVLAPIWTAKAETARRVRQRLELVFDWAKTHGHRSGDSPMAGIEHGLPKQRDEVEHMAALPYDKLPEFLTKLRASGADAITKLAFEFMVLTAARPGEARNARWDEIDLEAKLRTIPKDRMKAGVEHVVPLSPRAVEILQAAKALRRNDNELVFPARLGGALSDATLSKLARSLGFGHLTAHGFRSTFRDWASETTNFPTEVVEKALAHAIKSQLEAAYRRGDLLEKRRQLMGAWDTFAAGGANVVQLRAAG